MVFHADPVRLVLAGDEIAINESYDIREGIINQPSAFSLRLGHGGVTRELLAKYPPNTQFQLFIGDAPILYGMTDGFSTGDSGGATSVTFDGRDLGARIHDGFIDSDLSFPADKTFDELLKTALKAVGLGSALTFPDNNANRKAHAGSIIVATAPTIEETTLEDGSAGPQQVVPGTSKTVYQTIKAKLGTTWGEFLRQQFERAGLFFWADGSGGFVIAAPNPNQDPVYRIIRRRGITNSPVNVKRHYFKNNIQRRYTKCVVYGHGGGRNFGRTKNRGEYVDAEMSKLLGGDDIKILNVHDTHARDTKQAFAMARRKIAEANRNGYQLNYTVAGHTAPSLKGGGDSRAVWTPDTLVDVDDDELGLKGLFYIESCSHTANPQAETTIHLMRPQDLIFADPTAGET
jgi:prophage tail gpP-like protein